MTNMTTPYFVIDKMELDNNVISLQQALADGWEDIRLFVQDKFSTFGLQSIYKVIIALQR